MNEFQFMRPDDPNDSSIPFEDDGVEVVRPRAEPKWETPEEGKQIILSELYAYIKKKERERLENTKKRKVKSARAKAKRAKQSRKKGRK